MRITDLSHSACYLRLWDGDLTLVLQELALTDANGGGKLQIGILGRGGQIVAGSGNDGFELSEYQKIEGSPVAYPRRVAVDFKDGDVRVKGILTVTEVMQSLNVLGELSWPVRTVVKTFYLF